MASVSVELRTLAL
jgi:hypothetical protein